MRILKIKLYRFNELDKLAKANAKDEFLYLHEDDYEKYKRGGGLKTLEDYIELV